MSDCVLCVLISEQVDGESGLLVMMVEKHDCPYEEPDCENELIMKFWPLFQANWRRDVGPSLSESSPSPFGHVIPRWLDSAPPTFYREGQRAKDPYLKMGHSLGRYFGSPLDDRHEQLRSRVAHRCPHVGAIKTDRSKCKRCKWVSRV